jgi:hypothetical protein
MFAGYIILIVFVAGLPLSFGIGSLIGYLVGKVLKAKRGKGKIIVWSGIAYIISQPVSYIAAGYLEIDVYNIFFLVPFALGFTLFVSIIITMAMNSGSRVQKEMASEKIEKPNMNIQHIKIDDEERSHVQKRN